MVPAGSSVSRVSFDLRTQVGITAALAAVRESSNNRVEKNELRDLLLSYVHSGGDAQLRTELERRLAGLEIVIPVAPEPVASIQRTEIPLPPINLPSYDTAESTPATITSAPINNKVKSGIHRRGVPRFSIPSTVTKSPVTVAVIDVTPVTSSLPVSTTPVIPAAPIMSPAPVVSPTPQNTVHFSPHIPVSTSVVPTTKPQSSEPQTGGTQVATPTPSAVVPSLEPVPVSVVAEKLSDIEPVSTPSEELVPQYSEDASVVAHRARISDLKQQINARVGNPVLLIDMNPVVGRTYMAALLSAMKAVSGGGGSIPNTMTELEAAAAAVLRLLDERQATATPPETRVAETTATSVIPQPSNSVVQTPVTPVAAAEPLRRITDLPTEQDKKAALGITDPLLDPDVDRGLSQLLNEWPIFRKAGLFRSGPSGKEHPLFVTIANIPVPYVVAGRFEGVTPDIRQSITDYMNGWRYEQGIVHQNEETFEHYLRRVVKHILDSQKA